MGTSCITSWPISWVSPLLLFFHWSHSPGLSTSRSSPHGSQERNGSFLEKNPLLTHFCTQMKFSSASFDFVGGLNHKRPSWAPPASSFNSFTHSCEMESNSVANGKGINFALLSLSLMYVINGLLLLLLSPLHGQVCCPWAGHLAPPSTSGKVGAAILLFVLLLLLFSLSMVITKARLGVEW